MLLATKLYMSVKITLYRRIFKNAAKSATCCSDIMMLKFRSLVAPGLFQLSYSLLPLDPSCLAQNSSAGVQMDLTPPRMEAFCWLRFLQLTILEGNALSWIIQKICSLRRMTLSTIFLFTIRFLLLYGNILQKDVAYCDVFQISQVMCLTLEVWARLTVVVCCFGNLFLLL